MCLACDFTVSGAMPRFLAMRLFGQAVAHERHDVALACGERLAGAMFGSSARGLFRTLRETRKQVAHVRSQFPEHTDVIHATLVQQRSSSPVVWPPSTNVRYRPAVAPNSMRASLALRLRVLLRHCARRTPATSASRPPPGIRADARPARPSLAARTRAARSPLAPAACGRRRRPHRARSGSRWSRCRTWQAVAQGRSCKTRFLHAAVLDVQPNTFGQAGGDEPRPARDLRRAPRPGEATGWQRGAGPAPQRSWRPRCYELNAPSMPPCEPLRTNRSRISRSAASMSPCSYSTRALRVAGSLPRRSRTRRTAWTIPGPLWRAVRHSPGAAAPLRPPLPSTGEGCSRGRRRDRQARD